MKSFKPPEQKTLSNSRLKYLIKKYSRDNEIKDAINKIIEVDIQVVERCPNPINETGFPDNEILDDWTMRCNKVYMTAIRKLKSIKENNPDILALIAFGYSQIEDHRTAIKYYQRAIEIKYRKSFWKELEYNISEYAFESFWKSKFGKEHQKWKAEIHNKRWLKILT